MARRLAPARPKHSETALFLGFADLAAWLGVPARVLRAARKKPGFPESLLFAGGVEVWPLRQLERWKRTREAIAFIRTLNCVQTKTTGRVFKRELQRINFRAIGRNRDLLSFEAFESFLIEQFK